MPTARELLEQADALMRRNRAPLAAPDDIPELTEEVTLAGQRDIVSARTRSAGDAAAPAANVDDVPELTDAVAYVDAVSIDAVPDDEVTRWLESELGAQSVTGADPDSIAVVPPATLRVVAPAAAEALDEPTEVAPGPMPSPAPASAAAALAAFSGAAESSAATPRADYAFEAIEREPVAASDPVSVEISIDEAPAESLLPVAESGVEPPPAAEMPIGDAAAGSDDPARWAALAEEIRMQVLQRIDIFTDTGLQQQLTTRLQPIVDRASADLVATINQHVGTLLRAYVAEAIEREIEKWRQEGR